MKLLVLGATGGTGREIVKQAAASGHAVVALVRSNAPTLYGAEQVVGDARDQANLERALEGCDAVVSSLGTKMRPFRKVVLLSNATRALVSAMEAKGVRRLVCITGVGAGDSRGHGGFLYDKLLRPVLLRSVYADKDRQERIVRNSDLDWTLVRPTILKDAPGKGYRALTDFSGVHGGSIGRADVAAFVLQEIAEPKYLHQAPLVTW